MYWRRLCASMPASRVSNLKIHYKLNNIYSRNLTVTVITVNLTQVQTREGKNKENTPVHFMY